MKRLAQCAVLLAVCWSAQAQSTYEGITGYSAPSPITAPITGTGGWTFRPVADIEAVALGCFDYIVADRGSISIGLWDSSGVLLASNLVTTSSTLINETRYAELAAAVLLHSAQTYYLGAYSATSFGARLVGLGENESFTVSPGIIPGSVGYALGTEGFAFPPAVAGGDGVVVLGPNIRYTVVPEPSTTALFGLAALSLLGLRRRS